MTTTEQTLPNRTTLGILLIIVAVFMMSIQEALFKHFSADLSLWQTFTLRGLLALPLLFIIALFQAKQSNLLAVALQKWPLLRSLSMTLMFIAMYAAIPFLSLSVVAAGIYTAPVFVTLLSAYVIDEPVGMRGWFAIGLGFTGVLIVLQPGTDAFSFWTILPIMGGFFYALANVLTRSKCQTIPVAALALSLNLALLLTGIILSVTLLLWQPNSDLVTDFPYLFDGWSTMNTSKWLLIATLSVLFIGVGMALAGAYQSAPPSTIATFDYSYLIFMALWDYLFLSNAPNGFTVFGISLIIGAGLLVIRKDRSD